MMFVIGNKENLDLCGIDTSTLTQTTDGRLLYHYDLLGKNLSDENKAKIFNDSSVLALTEEEWNKLLPNEEVN